MEESTCFMYLYSSTQNVYCGRCSKIIRLRTQAVKLYRGGKTGRLHHISCALKEIKKGERILMGEIKESGHRNGRRRLAL